MSVRPPSFQILHSSRDPPLSLPEEDHRGDEAAGSRALREHALHPEAGRAGRPGLPGAGPEEDQVQAGPGAEGLDATPGAGRQDPRQHRGDAQRQCCCAKGAEGTTLFNLGRYFPHVLMQNSHSLQRAGVTI